MGQYRTEIGTAEVCDMLCRLGATANYRGFSYTAYAVLLCVQQQDRLLLVTKWLYPDVAKRYGTNWKAVERNIRTVITVVWEQNRAMLEGLARRPAASAPLRGAVPVHPVQQPPVRPEGGTGAELKRNIKRGRADPGVHPGVPAPRSFLDGAAPRPRAGAGGDLEGEEVQITPFSRHAEISSGVKPRDW